MRGLVSLALASASVFAISTAASAQEAPAAPAAASGSEATLGEIVVTARRRSESLQEVPQTVNAVTSDTLQKLNIRQFQDIQNVVPGLSLQQTPTGFQNAASLRGVSFDVNTGAQPTVAFYLNDAPVQLSFLFQSLFDVGQVEVLKGPQGTTRGISAPSGAMTITTHKPDLSEMGGYIDVTATDQHGRNVQGAINVPIIKDVLAVRLAGVEDVNDQDGVRSIHSLIRPKGETSALRASVSFEPSDVFNANITYQHLDNKLINFLQVTGRGPGAFSIGTSSFPASYNPALGFKDRAAVQDTPNETRTNEDLIVAQVDSRIFGQHLSYVGSYTHFKVNSYQESGHPSAGDVADLLPGVAVFQRVESAQVETTHEIRLASDPAPGRFFDYTVGAFYHWVEPTGHIINPGTLLPGAFGTTPVPSLAAYNPNYQIPVFIDVPSSRQETSIFGSVTLHLGDKTELSGGIRHMWSVTNSTTNISLGNGLLNLPAIGLPASFPCAALSAAFPFPVTNAPTPGDCIVNSAGVISPLSNHTSETPNIYNVSLSHHFTRDFLVYVNTGTAYRSPFQAVGIQGELSNSTFPGTETLSLHPSERSRSYEVGVKSTWMDGRLRLNASVFRQRFNNLTIYIPGIFYNNVTTGVAAPAPGAPGTYTPTAFDFTASVDALVQGFDVDTAFQITPNWNISAQVSYADGKVEGTQVPCNTFNAAGRPVFNTGGLISLCPGGSSSRLPLWSATFQTEYVQPVRDNVDGFIRLLGNYYPENKNRVQPGFTVGNYSLINLYLGVRSHDGAWEASIFARNAFNTQRALDISTAEANLGQSLSAFETTVDHPSGYFPTLTTNRREVGINVHYAFGSR